MMEKARRPVGGGQPSHQQETFETLRSGGRNGRSGAVAIYRFGNIAWTARSLDLSVPEVSYGRFYIEPFPSCQLMENLCFQNSCTILKLLVYQSFELFI